MLNDFVTWLKKSNSKSKKAADQILSSVKLVWKALDSEMELSPNKLTDVDVLEEKFFIPHFETAKVSEMIPYHYLFER